MCLSFARILLLNLEFWIFKLPESLLIPFFFGSSCVPFFHVWIIYVSAGRCHFDHRRGDLFTTLRVYQSWLRERSRSEGGSDSRSRRWCREHGLDERLLFEVNKIHGIQREVEPKIGETYTKMDGLGGGLKYFLFSSLFGEMIQFD